MSAAPDTTRRQAMGEKISNTATNTLKPRLGAVSSTCLSALMLLSACVADTKAAVLEEVIQVPVAVKTIYNQEVSHNVTVTIWRDDTRDRAPFLVLNHG